MSRKNYGQGVESDLRAAINEIFADTAPQIREHLDLLDEGITTPYDHFTKLKPHVLTHEEADKNHVVAVFYPFAVGKTALMLDTLRRIQSKLPPANIVGFPNNTGHGDHLANPYTFGKEDLKTIKNGSFHPIIHKNFTYLALRNITSIDVVGIEQGASMAVQARAVAAETGSLAVRSACLIEPPNVMDRTPDELLNALKATPSKRALRRANVDQTREWLTENFPHIHGKFPTKTFNRARYQSALDAAARLDDVNEALLEGLSHNQFGLDCQRTNMPLAIMRGRQSEVCPTFETVSTSDVLRQEQLYDYGKELSHSPKHIAGFVARSSNHLRNHANLSDNR
jgi:hypothetical protein